MINSFKRFTRKSGNLDYRIFMKKSLPVVLRMRLVSKHMTKRRMLSIGKTLTFTRHSHVVHYRLCSHATNECTADIEDETTILAQQPNKAIFQYAEEVVTKALRRTDVYREYDVSKNFIEGLDKFIRQSMRGDFASRPSACVRDLPFHATLLLELQCG